MRRTFFIGWVTLVLAIVTAGAASADEAGRASPRAASHVGRIDGDHVTWQSSFVGNADSSGSPHDRERVELARPVVADLDAARSPGVTAVLDAKGAVVALAIDTRRVPDWRGEVTVTLVAPVAHDGADVVLVPPLARGESTQRIEVSGGGELRFEPESALGLLHEVGAWSAPGISERERHEADALLGGRDAPLDESPIYLDATSSTLDRGLRGRALTATERARPGLILAIVVFVLLAAACAAAYRWLARDARIEEAEATLREEFEREAREGQQEA